MTLDERSYLHAVEVIERVAHRLEAAGGLAELLILDGMSADELALLVRREVGLPGPPQTPYAKVAA